jgi:ferrous iron transport protein B
LAELAKTALERIGQTQLAPFAQENVDQKDRKAVEAADRQRYAFVNKLVSQVERRKTRTHEINAQDKFDNVITNPWLGLPIFGLVMFLVFQISQSWVGPWIADWLVSWIDLLGSWVSDLMVNANPLLTSLLVDGIIGGFGAVVGFLPLVMVMYFLIALLEDCGYMARATVVLDPMFKKVGLSGKSMIPFIIGTGCAIPGIMAARTIPNERERNAAAMLAPFMPCGAKLPVIALFVGAFFPGHGWVGTAMYFVGIGVILLCALLVNAIAGSKGRRTFFIIELPEYKIPSFKRALQSMCSQGWAYIVKAGTIILLCNFAVHMMQSFSWSLAPVAEGADNSILATIATPFAYVLIPIVGYHAWQLAAAAVTGFIAKENVVGTLAVCYTFAINDDLEMESGNEVVDAMYRLSKVGALAYMMFNLFSPPCFAAIGAMNAEIKDKKWLFGGIALQLCVGYSLGYLVYTIGTLITDPAALHIPGAIWGGVAVAVMAGVSAILCLRTNQTCKGERICKQ